ncbi:DNA repair-scaffolding protein isoform X1 [Pezoporus flaviventris]|uniref:DNA repair-scaffolding protein isoform X1 n=1 Tax=Pezoporus flaviventris TaxID=889875 RepID=UPI002AB27739|nr:DNA repair-scaffolding protein isoform X1 [Pezoporus flaviventris]
MPSRKRKRFWNVECTSFPDETPLQLKKSNVRTSGAATSVSNAWLRCGDGFQSTSVQESLRPTDKKSRIKKHLGALLTSAECAGGSAAAESSKEAEGITWTSSGSDFSDDGNKTLVPRLQTKKNHASEIEDLPSSHEDRSNEDDLEFIDWEQDSDSTDRCDGSEKDNSSLEISDSDSCTNLNSLRVKEEDDGNDVLCKRGFQHIFVRVPGTLCSVKSRGDVGCWPPANLGQVHSNQFQWRLPLPEPCQSCLSMTALTEISEYSSDNDSVGEGGTGLVTTTPGSTKSLQSRAGVDTGDITARPASEWLRSAEALLSTPRKQAGKAPRALTESVKKRKLLRGGLAERLCQLQNRERSAISFWRHQCISDAKIPSDKSGVLIVKILEMLEECTIQVAICQQLEQSPDSISSKDAVINAREPILKVLFARETAAHLKSRPQDVIHIYPPWQKLILRNADVPVIMNTYFSEKVLPSEHSETREKTYGLTKMLIRKNIISLAEVFRLDDVDDESHEQTSDNQVACAPQICNNYDSEKHPLAQSAVNDSLLEMVESQGAVGWKEAHVRVVIQRVYCLPARGYGSHVQGNKPLCATPIINSDPPNVRLCLLVQDAYGMFSEVQLQPLNSVDDVEQYCRRWEGKFCCLAGMKTLQRTTRGRALGLFSLIESLWPPVVPVKVPGQSQESEAMTTNLAPPSFCYILTVQSGEVHVEVDEEEQISNLYQPPAVHGLKEILRMDGCNKRCSFWAQVLYLRLQTKQRVPINQREICLFVTDSTLQNVVHMIPKVVAVSVAASCVLSAEITEALSVTSQLVFFKDALWGNGRIICVERTVLLLQKPLLYSAAVADLSELTGPVRLDELDSTTQANSICAVRGTVVGVNESTAFSWPTCDRCGNGKLELCPQDRGLLYCSQCSEVVISPVLKMQLEVFLSCSSRPQSTVKVKLLQKTISSLLMSSASENGSYEVQSVLGKEVGLLNCYVRSVTSHPNCIALEEIVLLEAAARH